MKVPNGTNGKGHKAPQAATSRDLLAILFRQRRVLLVSSALIFFGVVSFALLLSDRYQAQALFLVTQDERADPVVSPGTSAQPDLNKNGVTVEEMNSEVALLLSRDLLEDVVNKCGLASKPLPIWSKLLGGWNLSKQQRVDKAVRKLADKLDIEVEKMSNIICELRFVGPRALRASGKNPVRGLPEETCGGPSATGPVRVFRARNRAVPSEARAVGGPVGQFHTEWRSGLGATPDHRGSAKA